MTAPTIKLSASERITLNACEAVIETGRQTFVEVGKALVDVRDGRLWREDYESFEAYCEGKWGWKKSYCNHVIRAAEVVKSLPPSSATIVATESQARELAKVEPEKRAAVLEQAAASGPVTAKSIKEASVESHPPGSEQQSEPHLHGSKRDAEPPKPDKSAEFLAACGNPKLPAKPAYSIGTFDEEILGLARIAIAEFDFETLVKAKGVLMQALGDVETKLAAYRKAERAKKLQEAA